MSKNATILKLETLVAQLHETIIRLKNHSDTNLPAIEIGLIEQKLITFYDEVQNLKSKNLDQSFSNLALAQTKEKAIEETESDNNVAEIRAQFESLKQQFAKNIEPEKPSYSMPFHLESNEIADEILEENIGFEIEGLLEMASHELELEIDEKIQDRKAEIKEDEILEIAKDKNVIAEKPKEISRPISVEKTSKEAEPIALKNSEERKKTEQKESASLNETKANEHKTINQSNSEILEKRTSLNDRFNGPKQPSLHEKLAMQKDSKEQLSKQMSGKPIKDLKKAINLNLQIRFQKELFENDNRAYKRAIEFLNKCNTYSEARSYIQHDLAKNFKNWEEENAHYQEFMGIIKRRFI